MQVTIKKVLRGREKRRVVSASQVAHSELVSNRDFIMVLTPSADARYTLTSAALWRQRPRPIVADRCHSILFHMQHSNNISVTHSRRSPLLMSAPFVYVIPEHKTNHC